MRKAIPAFSIGIVSALAYAHYIGLPMVAGRAGILRARRYARRANY